MEAMEEKLDLILQYIQAPHGNDCDARLESIEDQLASLRQDMESQATTLSRVKELCLETHMQMKLLRKLVQPQGQGQGQPQGQLAAGVHKREHAPPAPAQIASKNQSVDSKREVLGRAKSPEEHRDTVDENSNLKNSPKQGSVFNKQVAQPQEVLSQDQNQPQQQMITQRVQQHVKPSKLQQQQVLQKQSSRDESTVQHEDTDSFAKILPDSVPSVNQPQQQQQRPVKEQPSKPNGALPRRPSLFDEPEKPLPPMTTYNVYFTLKDPHSMMLKRSEAKSEACPVKQINGKLRCTAKFLSNGSMEIVMRPEFDAKGKKAAESSSAVSAYVRVSITGEEANARELLVDEGTIQNLNEKSWILFKADELIRRKGVVSLKLEINIR